MLRYENLTIRQFIWIDQGYLVHNLHFLKFIRKQLPTLKLEQNKG